MATPIPKHRLDALMSMPLCNHAWLSEPGRTYEDLSEHPNWAYHAARFQGADVALVNGEQRPGQRERKGEDVCS